MHIAAVEQIEDVLMPAVVALRDTLSGKASEYQDVVMLGRTHLQDATPVTLGQVIGGWVAQLDQALRTVQGTLPPLYELALGGTAVGTGLNTHVRFAAVAARHIGELTGKPFRPAPDFFAALSAHDAIVNASAALRTLGGALMKIANDVRWYASGPRGGIGELLIPANEPGSSIMPGKVNPTQAEALTQVAVQVFGNDAAVAFAGTQGNFQLNVYKPVMLHNLLESAALLAGAVTAFDRYCASGIEPNLPVIREHLEASLMLVTALTPHIGYERAARLAQQAHREGISLREAALGPDGVTAEQFDAWVRPEDMTHPDRRVATSPARRTAARPAPLQVRQALRHRLLEHGAGREMQLTLVLAAHGEHAVEVRLGGHELEDPAQQLLLDLAAHRVVDGDALGPRHGVQRPRVLRGDVDDELDVFEPGRQPIDDGGAELLLGDVPRRRQRLLPFHVMLVHHAVLHVAMDDGLPLLGQRALLAGQRLPEPVLHGAEERPLAEPPVRRGIVHRALGQHQLQGRPEDLVQVQVDGVRRRGGSRRSRTCRSAR